MRRKGRVEMTQEIEAAKARIRLYKDGRTRQEIWGSLSYEDGYVADCKLVADWYACHSDQADAERYRWLRSRHWSESDLCVVQNPRESVKPFKVCPSEDNLDRLIDLAISRQCAEKAGG